MDSLKLGNWIPPVHFPISRLIWLFGVFCVSIKISRFLVLWKMPLVIWYDCNESVVALGSVAFLTMLIFPIQEHGISFYLFVSSLISFIRVLLFLEERSFYSLHRFISRCFIVFDVMANGIVSLISLSDFVLLIYINEEICVY